MTEHLLRWVSALNAISQNGLTYSKNEFDIERYHELKIIAQEMAAHFSNKNLEEVTQIFALEKGYATPKLDVRAFILKEGRVLLVRERSDNLWALPGGWVDINESPSESVVREVKEESGYHVKIVKFLALWDKQKHDHPPQWPHVYKIIFLCEIVSGEKQENIEISEIDFFGLEELPDLSTHRVTKNQIKRLAELAYHSHLTDFD